MKSKKGFKSMKNKAFTIVELVVIIVVLGILASLATFGINKYLEDAKDEQRTSSVLTVTDALEKYYDKHGEYPSCAQMTGDASTIASDVLPGIDKAALVAPNAPDGTTNSIQCGALTPSDTDDIYVYTGDGSANCTGTVACSSYTITYYKKGDDAVASAKSRRGAIAITNGSAIQTITNANCPSTRTRAVDARDNRTYWVQKIADGKCWMLTNLAYAGGGTATYGDTKTLTNGTSGATTYTTPSYYIPTSGSNVTTEPTSPSTSTNGIGQYGYLYNWCAAMGGQTATSACANATTPAPDTNISICPAGWRLPTANFGEFNALNVAVNGGTDETDAGLLTGWLGSYSSIWNAGFIYQGDYGVYWSSTQYTAAMGFQFLHDNGNVDSTNTANKFQGNAVRCIAA